MNFESVYERDHGPLFRYIHRCTADEEAARDIAQECFVRYLRSDVPGEEARAWLFRVASNLIRDRHRLRTRRRRLLERWRGGREVAGPYLSPERALEVVRAREALDRLAERDRMMLLMREEGFSYREIAAAVDVAPASVGTLLARALQRFKDAYESG